MISNFYLNRYFSFIVAKPDAKVHACSILLRGPSKGDLKYFSAKELLRKYFCGI
jgi:hypothetical protein